tara:strand:- start:1534 stop:2058 length:525 start_codon:yes stop_codon:yes gene_type:complete
MNNITKQDLTLTTEWYNKQREEEGEEFIKTREYIENQMNEGERIIYDVIEGRDPFKKDKINDQVYLSQIIMQLMYFKTRIDLYKAMFNEWHSDELIQKNEQLSDGLYLKTANITKYYHELENTGVFDDVLEKILTFKLREKYTYEKGENILKICTRCVGNKLLQGKYLKSLKRR